MNATTAEKLQAVARIGLAIVESAKAAGELGIPGGTIYAALMGKGCTLEQYEKLMAILVASGKLRKRGDLYYATESA